MPRTQAVQPIQKMHSSEREVMQKKVNELRSQLDAINNRETGTAQSLDKGRLMRDLRRSETLLERDKEMEAKSRNKDQLVRRAKELSDQISKEMPSLNEMWPVRGGSLESERAIRKHIAWEREQSKNVQEWKNIMRRLEPDDPEASNVERLRRER